MQRLPALDSPLRRSFWRLKNLAPRTPNTRLACLILSSVLLAALAPSARAQSAQNYLYGFGRYSFSVPLPVERGYVDASNGNLHLEIPIAGMPERGHVPFVAALVYDSHIWQQVTANGSTTWQPTNVPNSWGGWRLVTTAATGGDITFSTLGETCTYYVGHLPVQYPYIRFANFAWTAPDGHRIPFSASTAQGGSNPPCGPGNVPSADSIAADASGYHIYLTNYTSATIFAPDGTQVFPNVKDTNGNYFSAPNSNGDVTADTLGRQPITTSTNGSTTTYQVLNSQGSSYSITVTTTTIQVCTNFGQSGVTENCSTSTPLTVVHSIGLPDNTSYIFGYDSGTTAGHYGVLTSMTLPTGGAINYQHTNFKDAYGNQNLLLSQRSAGGGTWTYTPAVSCGTPCQQTMTVARPNGSGGSDTEVHTFTMNQSTLGYTTYTTAWDIQQLYYTGAASPSNLAKTVAVTYDFTNPPYIQPLSVTTTLPMPSGTPVNTQVQFTNDTSNLGNVLTRKEWNFYTGSLPASPDRTVNYTYLANSDNNMVNKKTSVQMLNKSGAQVAYTSITYDAYGANGSLALASVTGVINHDDTNFGSSYTARGNPTLIQRYYTSSAHLDAALSFDTTGQVTQAQDPNSNVTQFSYADNFFTDNGANPPATYTPSQKTNAYLTKVTPPSGFSWTTSLGYFFDSGKLALATDPNGNTTYQHYLDSNNWDRATTTHLPIGWSLLSYTSATQIDSYLGITDTTPSTSCNGCRHDETTFESLGRVNIQTLVSDPENPDMVALSYDSAERISSVTNPYRSTGDSTYGYDSYSYDGLNRVLQLTHSGDSNKTNTYYGPAVTSTGAGGIGTQLCSSSTYGLGYPVLFKDEAGKLRQVWADGFGRTIEVDEPDGTGSLTVSTCYAYDALDNLTSVAQGTQNRTYAYDQLSRVTSATTPETNNHAVSFYYTKANGSLCSGNGGAVCRRTDAKGTTTTYAYDALNRFAGKTYSDSPPTPTVHYCYDQTSFNGLTITNGLARLTAAVVGTSCATTSNMAAYSYDADGRITTEQRTIPGTGGSITKTTTYNYNLDGTIQSIVYPSGHTFSYGVSKAERYTAAWDSPGDQFAQTASYAPMGALNSVIYGQVSGGFGGVTETRAYNSRLEFNSIQDSSSAGTAVNLSYNYVIGGTNNGSVGRVTNNSDSGRTQTFSYDPLNRILQASSSATSGIDCWGEQFGGTGATLADDRYSNLTSEAPTKTGNGCFGGNLGLTVNGNNQITAPSPITYDAASGNMTKDNRGFTYTYDAENRITQASGMTNGPYCYTYDALGLRVEKAHASGGTCSGTVTVDKLYWRSISGDTIAETDGSGSTTNSAYKEYVFFAGRRIASRDGLGNIFYYYTDHLGTTRSITDSHGYVCYDGDFDAYGMEIVHTNTCPQNYKFTGYERDPETADPNTGLNGLDYSFARYYSSSLGRFMSADPLGGSGLDPQSLNRYAYVGNDPGDFTDPVGLFANPCVSRTPGTPCNENDPWGWGDSIGPANGLLFGDAYSASGNCPLYAGTLGCTSYGNFWEKNPLNDDQRYPGGGVILDQTYGFLTFDLAGDIERGFYFVPSGSILNATPAGDGGGLQCDPKFIAAAKAAWIRSGDGTIRGLEAGFQVTGSAASPTTVDLPNTNEFGQITFNLAPGAWAAAHTHDNSSNPWPSPGDIQNSMDNNWMPFYTISNRGLYVTDPASKNHYRPLRSGLTWLKPCKK